MIDNYLDWVKLHRERAGKSAVANRRSAKGYTDPWLQGFYIGLGSARILECHTFRRLQKSLEEHIEYACTHSSPEVWERFSKSLLS